MLSGAIVKVLVAVRLALLVTLKYIALAGPSVALATVVVASASEPKDASVAYPKALPMRDKLVLVFVPHVPEAAPVVIYSVKALPTPGAWINPLPENPVAK